MAKQPVIDSDDKLGRLLEMAQRMDDSLRAIANEVSRLRGNYEADKAIEDAQRKADYEQQMRLGLQAPLLATRRYLASQQPRIDGDNKPWEPKRDGEQHLDQTRDL